MAALAISFVMRDRELPRLAIGMALVASVTLVVLGRRACNSRSMDGRGRRTP
jgi:hypothetical protein